MTPRPWGSSARPRGPASCPVPSGPSTYAPVAWQMPAAVATPAAVRRRTQKRAASDTKSTPEKPAAREAGGAAAG